jgi:beta-glucosidase-like glycosyl hydrolase
MGAEAAGKGIDVLLGPAVGPIGRFPTGGRNWEGFSAEPYLSGQIVAPTVEGIQSSGVIATTKHFVSRASRNLEILT